MAYLKKTGKAMRKKLRNAIGSAVSTILLLLLVIYDIVGGFLYGKRKKPDSHK